MHFDFITGSKNVQSHDVLRKTYIRKGRGNTRMLDFGYNANVSVALNTLNYICLYSYLVTVRMLAISLQK